MQELLAGMRRVLVCFSGGVDSSFLLAHAVAALGDEALAFTAVSPSLAPEEGAAAQQLAARLGARHLLVETLEVDDPRYAANPPNRCYFCKTEMYGTAVGEARRRDIPFVVDGFNLDDRSDQRPGAKAALELGVSSPLDQLGFTKAAIREGARQLGLPVWDKPALACLASRFPYGTEITPERLTRVARCEAFLRQLGFRVCRVRYHGTVARIEVESSEIARLGAADAKESIAVYFRGAGFDSIEVDPEGYRRGALHAAPGTRLVSLGHRR